ncbi:ubiquitin thioesterase otu1 [Phlyctema vagabunda]|uniref:Ubiquitin thioesterase OTU n=1 Tax=Phlyctema vagabunda TaxID=108571 RepID=A0ABR4PS35_9HELO
MRIRLRAPGGASTITLADDATVGDLISDIVEKTSVKSFDIKYGYPPKPLLLDQKSVLLRDLDVNLNGEQLTIGAKDEPAVRKPESESQPPRSKASPSKQSSEPVALKRKAMEGDVPEIPLPERGATLVLRVMPDDNSCLFRAFATAVLPIGDDQSMPELRSLVASTIQADPEKYTRVVLEKEPDDYCRWIQTEAAWGGAIEMEILANHYEVEICSIDVESGQPLRFNEGQALRCILVYSGIHYDTVVQSPSDPPHTRADSPPELDKRIFDTDDDEILMKALELCRKLNAKHYYTNTGSMPIKCNVCGWIGNGQVEASQHAQQTDHYDMAEVTR